MKYQRRFSGVSVGLCLVTMAGQVLGNPYGERIISGSARFDRSAPGLLSIRQGSDKLIINWRDFSIAAGETTRFIQPSATAVALNRVVSANPSRIYGNLEANGKVYLINQNGILVGPSGRVSTRSFVASTLDVSDASFLSGNRLHLAGDSRAGVVNEGSIEAIGGDVFLVGRTVENSGSIRAGAGTVGLGAGSEVMIMPTGRERLSVIAGDANAPQSDKGVNNAGTIAAVSAELKAAGGNIYALAINNGGTIRATGVRREGGRVFLTSDGGDILNSGAISANNADGSGGAVRLAGGHDPANPSTVFNTGVIEARGDAAGTQGGEVRLTGDYVGLFGPSMIDVSGHSGGGRALIGGDYQGANPGVQNATALYVGRDAVVKADALEAGDGGRVILWSDVTTRFYGSVFARGGANGGDGGFAEISGKVNLVLGGHADLGAPAGRDGVLLLDPDDLTITDTADGTGTQDDQLTPDTDPEILVAVPNDGGNTISRGQLEAFGAAANIRLEANGNITINDLAGDMLDLATGPGNSITFRADANDNNTGNFTMNTGDTIRTAGGAVNIFGEDFTIGNIDTTGGGASGGAVNLSGQNMDLAGTITSGSADITVAVRANAGGPNLLFGDNNGTGLDLDSGDLDGFVTSGTVRFVAGTGGNVVVSDGNGGTDTTFNFGALNISIEAPNNITFQDGDVISTTGNVTLSAGTDGTGNIPGPADGIAHVIGNTVTLATTDGAIGSSADRFFVTANSLAASTAGGAANDIFITDTAGGLAGVNINAGASGNVILVATGGAVTDTDAAVDITAATVTITADSVGATGANNALKTAVADLNVNTSGANGNQFIEEMDGLTAFNLNAGTGNVTLSGGAIADTDVNADIVATDASVTATSFGGSGANAAIDTDVSTLTVDTSAANGNQFIDELNALTGLNLNAGSGNVTLTAGAITDTDGGADITAGSVNVTAASFGATGAGNAINTSVDSLTVNTSAGGGSQFIAEGNGLTALNLSAGTGSVELTLANGSVADTDANADITAANVDVNVTGANSIGSSANPIALAGVTGTADLSAAGGGVNFAVTAAGDLEFVSSVDNGADITTVFSAGTVNYTATYVDSAAGDFGVHATAGSILDNVAGVVGQDVLLAPLATLTLMASDDIGAGVATPIRVQANGLTATSGGVAGDDVFLVEADGLTALNLNAGAGNATLTLSTGTITDTDTAADITAFIATVTAAGFGTSVNRIDTAVSSLSVDTSAANGNQFITEANALTGLDLNAGTGGVTLTAGAITDTDVNPDIIAANANVTAASFGGGGLNAAIDTAVDTLTVDTSAANGDQFIEEANALTALDLNAGTGGITLTAGAITDIDGTADIRAGAASVTAAGFGASGAGNAINTAVNGLSVDTSATGADQFIAEANGLTALNLNAGAGSVTLAAGAITDTDVDADITAGTANVTATSFGASGAGNAINTAVASLNVDTAAANGSQFINEADALTALNLNAGGGSVTLTAGAITDADSAADITAAGADVTAAAFGLAANSINTVVNTLSVNTAGANGDQFIAELDTLTALNLNAGAGNVTLTAGAITDTDAGADISAGTANVTATSFGGVANAIDTAVGGLTVDTSAANTDQFIDEADALTALNLNAGSGTVTLTAGVISDTDSAADITAGAANVTAASFGAAGNSINTVVNTLSVNTAGANGDQFIAELDALTALNLSAGSGTVTLTAGAITDTDAGADISAGTANVTATSFGAVLNAIDTAVGGLTVDTSAANADQFIDEADALTALNLNAGSGSVTLTAGAITDTDSAADITASTANVTATSFGAAGNLIGTAVASLNVDTSAANGDQFITEFDALTALNLNAGSGDVTLTAGGDITDADTSADITADSAMITATRLGNAANAINTAVNGLGVDTSAANGDQAIAEADALTALDLRAGSGAVTLTAGAITDADGAADITAGGLSITATSVGAVGNGIDTAVASLSVNTSAANGNQFIDETDALTALNLNAGTGNITLTAGAITDTDTTADITATMVDVTAASFGMAVNNVNLAVTDLSVDTSAANGDQHIVNTRAMTALDLDAGTGDVRLSAVDVADADANTDIRAQDVTVTASGTTGIGSSANPLEIDAAQEVELRAAAGSVHVEVATMDNIIFGTPLSGFTAQFDLDAGAQVYRLTYGSDLTVRANGNINGLSSSTLRVPGVLRLDAAGSIGGAPNAPMQIDAGTLHAVAGRSAANATMSLQDINEVILGGLSSSGGNIFVRANILDLGTTTDIDAGAGTVILVGNTIPGIRVAPNSSPTIDSRFVIFAPSARTTIPQFREDLMRILPFAAGRVIRNSPFPVGAANPIPSGLGAAENAYVFASSELGVNDPSLFIDIPVEVFEPVSIVFGDYDPTKFGEFGELWMSSSELYEIERKAGKARKPPPAQVDRAKYVPEGN